MTGLDRWVRIEGGPFRFKPENRREPVEVTVRRTVIEPGPDGPVQVGEPIIEHYIDGRRVGGPES